MVFCSTVETWSQQFNQHRRFRAPEGACLGCIKAVWVVGLQGFAASKAQLECCRFSHQGPPAHNRPPARRNGPQMVVVVLVVVCGGVGRGWGARFSSFIKINSVQVCTPFYTSVVILVPP